MISTPQAAQAMAEEVAEVVAKTTIGEMKMMKMESLEINPKSPAITVKERGILQMNVGSPRRKDRKRMLWRRHT